MPYEVERACRFECCTYRQWSVREPTALHLGRDSSSAVVARVRAGDHVDGLTGMVVTTKPGRAVVLAPTTFGVGDEEEIDVRAGQVLYLLHYQGEGSFKVWLEGRLLDTDIPFLPDSADPRADLPGADATLRTESYPETVWWVKVRTRDGVVGWSAQPDHFGDKDACG